MSQYAWLACEECKEIVWMGKVLVDSTTKINFFHIGTRDEVCNSRNTLLTAVVMKFLAQHMKHALRVWTDDDLDQKLDSEYTEIGGDCDADILFDDYVDNFRG